MEKLTGISLSVNGGSVSVNAGYIEKENVFVQFRKILTEFQETRNPELETELWEILSECPDPDRRETWIDHDSLKAIKTFFREVENERTS